jgi:hypothetical protein
VLPFILRRTKASVAADLPTKTIVDVTCPLSHVQRRMYADFQKGNPIRISDTRNFFFVLLIYLFLCFFFVYLFDSKFIYMFFNLFKFLFIHLLIYSSNISL